MSGFIAVVNRNGAPADPDLLWRSTRIMAYRGPDAQQVRTLGNAGLGVALLRTTFEAQREEQPCTVDGRYWIAADCRIDAREELILALESKGRNSAREASDPELILHAWVVWGADCVFHLLGDFSFAIWDTREEKIFCARDHMGVRLLYYALTPECLIVSNSLQALRAHPAIPGKLNELAIADYLIFGANQDLTSTSFQGIHRLRAAHRLQWCGGEPRIDRYWDLPVDPPLYFRKRQDYVDRFLDLLRTVMRDRLRCDKVAIMMSGGLDSSGLAAIAREISGDSGSPQVKAYTIVFDSLVPDRERYFAGLVAAHLGIPIRFDAQDGHRLFQVFPDADLRRIPDPAFISAFGPDSPSGGILASAAAGGTRVAFLGEGADDALFYEWKPWVKYGLDHGRIGGLLRDAIAFPFLFGQVPGRGRFFRRKSSRRMSATELAGRRFPSWIRKEFAEKLQLEERYSSGGTVQESRPIHPVRPWGHANFSAAAWQFLFEMYDPEVTGLPLEVRHPYADIRMLRFLFAVPSIPWCRNKYLLRRAFAKYLPHEVLARPKETLPGFPNYEKWKQTGLPANLPKEAASEYVDFAVLERLVIESPYLFGDSLRPFALEIFIAHSRRGML